MPTKPVAYDFFPPTSRAEMSALGWEECDVILVSGDAYVDHPAFGSAVIVRSLINAGFRTGVIAQPDWRSLDDFRRLGRPRLFFGVTAGNVDSLVNHYSPLKQRRRTHAYSPGGKAGLRPNRATIVYCNCLRAAFPEVPLVIGGIEASLRRLAHYDYWDDKVRRSLLIDARADILVYGMAESAVVDIARRLAGKQPLHGIPGTVVVSPAPPASALIIPGYEAVAQDKQQFIEAFMLWHRERDQPNGRIIAQRHGNRFVIHYPPPEPLSTAALDAIYDLPYTRQAHPCYREKIPALETVRFSITSHRGCLGSCTFCSLSAHQGRIIQSRSVDSMVAEARRITQLPGFKGHITDVGGPTANMYGATCARLAAASPCRDRECLYPEPCPSLQRNLHRHLAALKAIQSLPGVKKVSIGTGLRFDLLSGTEGKKYLQELCRSYISGQLRIAPEHVSESVLRRMRKSSYACYQEFRHDFYAINERLGKTQYLIPYFISGFPGCTVEDMLMLAEHIHHQERFLIRQVQDFTPLPMTAAATMYYTGIDPFTGEKLTVARAPAEKRLQRALMQLRDPACFSYALAALQRKGDRRALHRLWRLRPPAAPRSGGS